MSNTSIRRTDDEARYIDGFANQWVPRYVSEELERELVEALDRIKQLESLSWYSRYRVACKERDDWKEAAYNLAEAIPASWDKLQPPAAQLQKFKEMTAIENEKIKKEFNL